MIQSTVLSYMLRRASLRMDQKPFSGKPTEDYHLSLQNIYHLKALILNFKVQACSSALLFQFQSTCAALDAHTHCGFV